MSTYLQYSADVFRNTPTSPTSAGTGPFLSQTPEVIFWYWEVQGKQQGGTNLGPNSGHQPETGILSAAGEFCRDVNLKKYG